MEVLNIIVMSLRQNKKYLMPTPVIPYSYTPIKFLIF